VSEWTREVEAVLPFIPRLVDDGYTADGDFSHVGYKSPSGPDGTNEVIPIHIVKDIRPGYPMRSAKSAYRRN
jgi:hypothetical protein